MIAESMPSPVSATWTPQSDAQAEYKTRLLRLPSGLGRICITPIDSMIPRCVNVDGNGDGNSMDSDLDHVQRAYLRYAFAAAIDKLNGQSIGHLGTSVVGAYDNDQEVLLRVTSQFIGAFEPSAWDDGRIRIVVEMLNGDAGRLDRNVQARDGFIGTEIKINWGIPQNRWNPSAMARVLLHELGHMDDFNTKGRTPMAHNKEHKDLDERAKAKLREYGLHGLGCPSVANFYTSC